MGTLGTIFAGDRLEQELRAFCLQSRPDQPIMPERRLAEQYGISHGTVRRVLDGLLDDGVIYKIHGKGTFVAGPRPAAGDATILFADTWLDAVHPYFAGRLKGIVETAERLKLRLEVVQCDPRLTNRETLLNRLTRQEMHGLILPWITDELLDQIRAVNRRVQVVVTTSPAPPLGVSAILVDYVGMGCAAMKYLASRRVRRPVCVVSHPPTRGGIDMTCELLGLAPRFVDVPSLHACEPKAVAADIEQLGGDGLMFDDDQIAAQLIPSLGSIDIPLVSHDNSGAGSLPGHAARLVVDSEIMGGLIVQHLHGLITATQPGNATIHLRPVLNLPKESL